MRARLAMMALLGVVYASTTPLLATAATTTTIPVTSSSLAPVVSTTTSTSTTTTTVPSAVTTVPEGCELPPTAQAVFVGKVQKLSEVSAVYQVLQVRAGSLDGYVANGTVDVRYGRDAKFLDSGFSYIVGVTQDPVTLRLSSTIHEAARLFGGADVAGSNTVCPKFEEAARTLHMDGTAIDSGIFTPLFESRWPITAALVVGPILILFLLYAAVWIRRSVRRH